jgi:hypothetical protein
MKDTNFIVKCVQQDLQHKVFQLLSCLSNKDLIKIKKVLEEESLEGYKSQIFLSIKAIRYTTLSYSFLNRCKPFKGIIYKTIKNLNQFNNITIISLGLLNNFMTT